MGAPGTVSAHDTSLHELPRAQFSTSHGRCRRAELVLSANVQDGVLLASTVQDLRTSATTAGGRI